jgi:hypothetical protein
MFGQCFGRSRPNAGYIDDGWLHVADLPYIIFSDCNNFNSVASDRILRKCYCLIYSAFLIWIN